MNYLTSVLKYCVTRRYIKETWTHVFYVGVIFLRGKAGSGLVVPTKISLFTIDNNYGC